MKCTYCEKEAEYSLGWLDDLGHHQNMACDGHKWYAKMVQESELKTAQFKDRLSRFTKIVVKMEGPESC